MTKAINTTSVTKKTGIEWPDWVMYLDKRGAQSLPHADIAAIAYERLQDSLENAGWWAQSIAVAYEQHIGRRQPGQRSDGTFETSVTRTFAQDKSATMERWLTYVADKQQFAGINMTGEPKTTRTNRNIHWGHALDDGTRLNIDVSYKAEDKALMSITHTKLVSADSAAAWKDYWKAVIQDL